MTGKWRIGSGGKEWDGSRLLERLPLEKRLNLMTFIIIIPLAVLVIYLMATVAKFCNAYTQSITNITQAMNSSNSSALPIRPSGAHPRTGP